jgi:acetyltransferase-like isoleucine patch superfamily enzyme
MAESDPRTFFERVMESIRIESAGLHPRLLAAYAVSSLLPSRASGETRARVFSSVGFRIGRGTSFQGAPLINGSGRLAERLEIGRDCFVGLGCILDLEECISIGDRVTLSPGAMLLTSSHELASKERRAGPLIRNPIKIQSDAWIGPRAIILPGVTIGEGAKVNPASVVNKDVPPHTRVGGAPAIPIVEAQKS